MSLTKNLKSITNLAPRAVISWERAERIRRNKEIWDNKDSIVHRLPLHYQRRYWKNVLREAAPVHYRPPQSRFSWDTKRLEIRENLNIPIVGIHPPEADEGLWGGESVLKGYVESRPYTKKKVLPRHWVPHLWFPYLKQGVFYSEILDRLMKITVTERTCRLIDKHFGIDLYLLETPEIDLASRLGNKLKRELLIALAKEEYFADDAERHSYIRNKYSRFKIPLEEAEWVGLELNEACRKQQDIEDAQHPEPLKYKFELDLVEKLRRGEDLITNEEEFRPKKTESLFGERLMGKYFNPLAEKFRKY